MSKQVLTPRFYVDIPSFIHAMGYTQYFNNSDHGQKLLYMNAAKQKTTGLPGPAEDWTSQWHTLHRIGRSGYGRANYGINFCALLNHNYAYLTAGDGHTTGMDGEILFYAKRYDVASGNTGMGSAFNNYVNVLNSGTPSRHPTIFSYSY